MRYSGLVKQYSLYGPSTLTSPDLVHQHGEFACVGDFGEHTEDKMYLEICLPCWLIVTCTYVHLCCNSSTVFARCSFKHILLTKFFCKVLKLDTHDGVFLFPRSTVNNSVWIGLKVALSCKEMLRYEDKLDKFNNTAKNWKAQLIPCAVFLCWMEIITLESGSYHSQVSPHQHRWYSTFPSQLSSFDISFHHGSCTLIQLVRIVRYCQQSNWPYL